MNIFAYLNDRSRILYGTPIDEVEEQLRNGRYTLLEGTVFTDTGLFLKCVGEIYQGEKGKVPQSKINSPNQCYNVKSVLDITDCQNKDCGNCHLKAIEMYKQKLLKKKRK